MRRKNRYVPNKFAFSPTELKSVYHFQDENYRVRRVGNLKKYHAAKSVFLETKKGKKFLSYKISKYKNIHGIDVWFVDGQAIRNSAHNGDIEFERGAHGYRQFYVPQYEIWVDNLYAGTTELSSIIWQLYLERSLMIAGKPYDFAYEMGSRIGITLRDGKYFVLPVGTYRQAFPGTCGPAALKIVLDYLRWPISENYLGRLCKTSIERGTSPQDLVRAARKLSFKADEREHLTIDEVKKLINDGYPIIANYQYRPEFGEGHYAVIIGYSDDEYVFSDPSEDKGYTTIKIADFMKQWYELEDKTTRQGIIIQAV